MLFYRKSFQTEELLLAALSSFLTGIRRGPLTTRPENRTLVIGESVDFHCSTYTRVIETGEFVPVNWMFDKAKDCVYCNGQISKSHNERLYVKTSAMGEYTLHIQDIMMEDSGVYTCINNAGYGPDEASAILVVKGEYSTGI